MENRKPYKKVLDWKILFFSIGTSFAALATLANQLSFANGIKKAYETGSRTLDFIAPFGSLIMVGFFIGFISLLAFVFGIWWVTEKTNPGNTPSLKNEDKVKAWLYILGPTIASFGINFLVKSTNFLKTNSAMADYKPPADAEKITPEQWKEMIKPIVDSYNNQNWLIPVIITTILSLLFAYLLYTLAKHRDDELLQEKLQEKSVKAKK